MSLTERAARDAVKEFLEGGKAKARKKAAGEKAYLLRLPAEEMARVKIAAARRGETMKEFFAYALAKACIEEERNL